MYIIIVGGGKIGYHLAKALLDEGHEVLIIEKDRARTDFITNELGSVCLRGDGCEASTLAEAGTGRADMLISVTGDDEDNLVACQIAKHKFNVRHTIARSNNPKNEILFKKLGIDVVVSGTNVILEHIEHEVPTHPLTHLLTIRDTGLEIVEVRISSFSSNIGKHLKDIVLPSGCVISLLIHKQQKPEIPGLDSTIQTEDQIIALTPVETEQALRDALRGE